MPDMNVSTRLIYYMPSWMRRDLSQWFDVELFADVDFILAPWWARWLMRLSDGVLLTLGDTIYYAPKRKWRMYNSKGASLIAHELVHVEQWRELGRLRFALRYATEWLWCKVRRQPYWDVSFEREAYILQDEVQEELSSRRRVRVT